MAFSAGTRSMPLFSFSAVVPFPQQEGWTARRRRYFRLRFSKSGTRWVVTISAQDSESRDRRFSQISHFHHRNLKSEQGEPHHGRLQKSSARWCGRRSSFVLLRRK